MCFIECVRVPMAEHWILPRICLIKRKANNLNRIVRPSLSNVNVLGMIFI